MTPGLPDEHFIDEISQCLRIEVSLGNLLGHLIVRYSHASWCTDRLVESRTVRGYRLPGLIRYLQLVIGCQGLSR